MEENLGGSQTDPAKPLKQWSSSLEGILWEYGFLKGSFAKSIWNLFPIVKTRFSGFAWMIKGNF